MPKQGQSVESCIISQWFKKKGENVKAGEPLFSYETDKASFEEEAKADGILLEIFYGEGDEAPVLCNVAVIGEVGEPVEEFRPDGSIAAIAAPVPPAPPPSPTLSVIPAYTKIRVSPRARAIAEKKGVNLATVKGTGPNGRIIARDLESSVSLPSGEGRGGASECEVKKLTNIRKLIAKASTSRCRAARN